MSRAIPLLRAAHHAGWITTLLALGRWSFLRRPVLGNTRTPNFSAVRSELVDASVAGDVALDSTLQESGRGLVIARPDQTCDAFATALVAARAASQGVWVHLP
jgi:hypothetical protein